MGYTMSLRTQGRFWRSVELTVRIDAPSGGADDVITYPYLVFSGTVRRSAQVTLISTVDGREKAERVNLALWNPASRSSSSNRTAVRSSTEESRCTGLPIGDLGSYHRDRSRRKRCLGLQGC